MKRAIVLAGGGARGSYQMGFWRALRELEIDYQIVTGSSVGALNAALLASGNYDDGLLMWSSITTDDIVLKSPSKLSKLIDTEVIASSLKSLVGEIADDAVNVKMDPFPLTGLLNKFFSEKQIRESGVELGIMTSEYPSLKQHPVLLSEIPYGMMDDYLLASSTVFPSMDPKKIAGISYVDGGYSDNFPINLALDMGAEEIIGCRLNASGVEAKYQTNYPVRVIEPHFKLGAAMVFDPVQSEFNRTLGYNDTMRSFGVYDGSCYTFKKGERATMNELMAKYFADTLLGAGVISVSERSEYYKTLAVKAFAEARQRRLGRMREELPMLAAETAAELFKIDPKPVYEHRELANKVLKKFEACSDKKEAVEKTFSTAKTLMYKMNSLKDMDKSGICAYIAEKLCMPDRPKGSEAEFKALCRVAPQEFFSAVYISFLKKHGEMI